MAGTPGEQLLDMHVVGVDTSQAPVEYPGPPDKEYDQPPIALPANEAIVLDRVTVERLAVRSKRSDFGEVWKSSYVPKAPLSDTIELRYAS